MNDSTRRSFLVLSTAAGASVVLGACKKSISSDGAPTTSASAVTSAAPAASSKGDDKDKGKDKEKGDQEVTAVEDLMREHGVIRRALIVYRVSADRLRTNAAVPPSALEKTAKLFRSFAENYHEKKLEEEILFPAVKRAGGAAALLIAPLLVQHDRGRQVTDYVLAAVKGGKIGVKGEELAKVLDSFTLMYAAHAAREDTIVFPAWKKTMDPKQYDEMGERFEDIEKQTFGHDGFDDASDQIGAIEQELGLADLSALTPPPPPKI